MPHPFVTVAAANAGCLESPAYARRGLVPKVPIGTKWEPHRSTVRTPSGEFRGYQPEHGLDAVNVQAALLPKGLGEMGSADAKGSRIADALWWALGVGLLLVLLFLVGVYADAPVRPL